MKKKMNYVSPQIKVTRVSLEQGIAVKVSCSAYLESDWIEIEEPIGLDTSHEGGDIVLFF